MKANNPHDNTGVPKLTFEKWLEQATPRNPLKTQFDRMRAGNPAEPSNPSGKGWSETGKGDY